MRCPGASPAPTRSTSTTPAWRGTPRAVFAPLGARVRCESDLRALVAAIAAEARDGDHILVMSNGGFGGIHQKLLDGALAAMHRLPARLQQLARVAQGAGAEALPGGQGARRSRTPARRCRDTPARGDPRHRARDRRTRSARRDVRRQFAGRVLRDLSRRKARLPRRAHQSGDHAARRPGGLSRHAEEPAYRRALRADARAPGRLARAAGRARSIPERYLLLLETGDEVLDWREAARKYEGARR